MVAGLAVSLLDFAGKVCMHTACAPRADIIATIKCEKADKVSINVPVWRLCIHCY